MKNINKFVGLLIICISGIIGGYSISGGSRQYVGEDNGSLMKLYYSPNGVRKMDLGVYKSQPIQEIFNEDGKLHIQLGIYSGEIRINERGLPVITTYDNAQKLRHLFRLDGENQVPLVILKNTNQKHGIIMGLDLFDKDEEPFFAYYDKDGNQHMLFGEFSLQRTLFRLNN